jgi:sugar O-acyltransferase (sialic acid O-acetyltransferase NeuD family)
LKPALIIGASSFGRLVRVLAEEAGVAVAGFVDDFNSSENILGRTDDLGTRLKPEDFDLIMGIGYKHMEARGKMFGDLVRAGFDFPTLRHPTARISSRATLGAGCLVMAGVDIDSFTRIEDACVIWPHATISHDNRIGGNTFVSPGATLCGFVAVGDSSFIGANSTIVDGSSLPPHSFVKAGSRHNSRLNKP